MPLLGRCLGCVAVVAGGVGCTSPGDGSEADVDSEVGFVETAGAGTSEANASTQGDEGEGGVLDLPPDDGGDASGGSDEGSAPPGCANVDLLFVVDNSLSMVEEQGSLVSAFPEFAATMLDKLESAESFHVGVVTSDAYQFNDPGCQGLGDLVTRTGGEDAYGEICTPFGSGKRFIDESEQDLAASFRCIAQVGTWGSHDEKMLEAGWSALEPENNAVGACNEGFIREDALLVLVVITDEQDKSPGAATDWYERIVAAKSGIEKNVAVLSLVGLSGSGCAHETGHDLVAFTEMFTNGSVGDVCSSDYDAFFSDAIEVIDVACDGFIPPG